MRYTKILLPFMGQSQAMFAGLGVDHVDTAMTGSVNAGVHLKNLLEDWMPGVTATNLATLYPGSGGKYTGVGGTALIRTFNNGGDAFWHDVNGALDVHGAAQRDYMIDRADPTALCIFMHWCHTGDAKFSGWTDQAYADGLANYYAAMNAALSPHFAEFRILPIPAGSIDSAGQVVENLGMIRDIMDALGGARPPLLGKSAQPYILQPIYGWPYIPRGAYDGTSPDFIHPIRSSAWRVARSVAARITAHNGVTPPVGTPPRLSHARMVGANTLRAYIVSPGRLPMIRQGLSGSTSGFVLVGPGAITNQSAPFDNSAVAETGYATIDINVTGVTKATRLAFLRGLGGYSSFDNSTTPPRGLLRNAFYCDPGDTPAITDECEDLLGDEVPLFMQQNQFGVGIDTLSPS